MQITIDTTKLPEGTTVQDVYDAVVRAMGGFIGDFEGYADVDEEKAALAALVAPGTE